jgi:hypothetical protein
MLGQLGFWIRSGIPTVAGVWTWLTIVSTWVGPLSTGCWCWRVPRQFEARRLFNFLPRIHPSAYQTTCVIWQISFDQVQARSGFVLGSMRIISLLVKGSLFNDDQYSTTNLCLDPIPRFHWHWIHKLAINRFKKNLRDGGWLHSVSWKRGLLLYTAIQMLHLLQLRDSNDWLSYLSDLTSLHVSKGASIREDTQALFGRLLGRHNNVLTIHT